MFELVVVSLPVIETRGPTPGIYYIKGSAEQIGFKSIAKDMNVWLQKQDVDTKDMVNYFVQSDISKLDRNCQEHLQADMWFRKYIDENFEIFSKCKRIGISLFSVYNIYPGIIFCEIIRELFPEVEVIVGGNGTEDSGINGEDVGEYFINSKLAKYAVYGEGEEAIQHILQGKPHPSVNSKRQRSSIDDLNKIAYPDYEDFFNDFPEYKDIDVSIPLIGSRGCVRRCTFCNVGAIWPLFRFRSGENIAQEMINNKEKYNVSLFRFTDSLINGSMKAYRELCNILAEYNTVNHKDPIRWSGQFICRSKSQMPPEDFEKMRRAGCTTVSIGIESGSEKVRNDIRKGFTEEDMIYTLDQCAINNIKIHLMFIVGYPTETDEDFQKNIDLLKKYSYYKDRMEIKVGKTLRLLDNTPLTDEFSHLFYYDDNKESEWVSTVVPDLTFEKRVERAKELRKVAQEIGYELKNIHDDENFFENKLKKREA